jgi:hypothetical protein
VDHGSGLDVASRPGFGVTEGAWSALPARVRKLIPLGVLAAGLVAYYLIYQSRLGYAGQSPVRSDGEGYYAYLPSYLLYHDVSFRSVISDHLSRSRTGLPPSVFGFSQQPTGNWLDKYPAGEAILLLPFFVIGHFIAQVMGAAADGYSPPELYAAGLAGLVYTVLGLSALGAALRRWFSEWVTAATLLAVTFGTGVFDYATYDSIFSHAFSFFAVSVTLLCALRWYERPRSMVRAVLLGLAFGAVVAVRLTDVVLLPAVLLLGVGSWVAARQRLTLLRKHAARVAVAAAAALAVLVPQLITWYFATQHLLVRPYPGESFGFSHPQLIGSLLSFKPHGLLPYAPVLVIAFGGLVAAWRWRRDLAVPVTVAFVPFWYLVATWWDWSFTAGFGDRAFNDVVPFLAIPLAFAFARLSRPPTRVLVGGLCVILVAVTCVLMVNHWLGPLPGSGTGPAGYFRILTFGG